MTTPTAPAPRSAAEILGPLRELIAFALLAAAGLAVLHALAELIPAGSRWAVTRTFPRFVLVGTDFVTLLTVVAPVLAVLVAVLAGGPVARARFITTVALLELAAVAFFGLVFNVLIAFIGAVGLSFVDGVKWLLAAAPEYLLLAAALFVVFKLRQGMFPAARSQPPAHPGQQPGFGQVYGQPAPQPTHPPQPAGAPYGQAGPGQPQQYAPPYGAQPYGQQEYPPQAYAAPGSAPPSPGYGQPSGDPYQRPAAPPDEQEWAGSLRQQIPQPPAPDQASSPASAPPAGAPASAPPAASAGRIYGRRVTPEEDEPAGPDAAAEDPRTRMLSPPPAAPPEQPDRRGPQ